VLDESEDGAFEFGGNGLNSFEPERFHRREVNAALRREFATAGAADL
jgi:hypothetical protein